MTSREEERHLAAPGVDPNVVARCRAVLRQQPAGLLSDIDGTLSAIAPTPVEAFVAEGIKASLRRLSAAVALVAVVSGRAAAAGHALVGIDDLIYIGNHGMERWQNGVRTAHPLAVASSDAVGAALMEIGQAIAATPLASIALVEHKGLSGTVHFRLADDHDEALAVLGPIVAGAAAAHGLRVTAGRAILELRPPARIDKGTAVSDLLQEHALRGVIFLGDDLTDVDAFAALKAARAAGKIDTLSIGVIGPETLPVVRAAVDVTVNGVEGVAALLHELATDPTGESAT